MANRCQLCAGEPRIASEDWRSVWLGDLYLEWGRCCNERDLKEALGEYPVLHNAVTGESVTIHTPQELWTTIGGEPDSFGEAIW